MTVYYKGYEIFKDGRIYSLKSKKFLKQQDNGNGYKKISLRYKGDTLQLYIHRIVAFCYILNIGDKTQVDHIDRNKNNNSYKNLRWVTPKENINNIGNNTRYSHKRICSHRGYNAKIIVQGYYFILNLSISEISRDLNIPRQTVSSWVKEHK